MKNVWNKVTRNIAILAGAVILTAFALYFQKNWTDQRVQTKTVVVPKDNLKPFSPLKGNLTTREIVLSEIPQDAIIDLKELDGDSWYVGDIGLMKSEPIRKTLITTGKASEFGHSLTLREGNHLLGIATDQARSAGDTIRPGVLVDAVVYIKGDQTRRAQTITAKEDPNLGGLLVRDHQNQEGLTIGEKENKSLVPSVAIVEVNDEQMRALVQYQEEGKVYLAPKGVDKDYIDNYLKDAGKASSASSGSSSVAGAVVGTGSGSGSKK